MVTAWSGCWPDHGMVLCHRSNTLATSVPRATGQPMQLIIKVLSMGIIEVKIYFNEVSRKAKGFSDVEWKLQILSKSEVSILCRLIIHGLVFGIGMP